MTVKEEAMGFKVFKINKYEPVEDERRLSEFAQKGKPKNMRYCIEASYLRAGGKKKRFYAENGWRLVCRGLDINIFSDSITTEELLRNIICAVQDYAA